MIIKTNEHVFIAGQTQSGKSTWLKAQLSKIPRFIFFDPKREHDIDSVLVESNQELIDALNKGFKRILYQPIGINIPEFDQMCDIIFQLGNITLIIDETASYCSPGELQPNHEKLMTQGRSRGIGVWNSTQRPRMAHNTLISETQHVVAFKLILETDRKKLMVFSSEFEKCNLLKDHRYIYKSDVMDKAEEHAAIRP